jgi:hypothetical protein
MTDHTIVVLSQAEGEALSLMRADGVIRWLRGTRDSASLQIGARLTEGSTVFTVSGHSVIVESWLAERCKDKWAGPGSRMVIDDNAVLVVKRCVIAPQPPQARQTAARSSSSESDDFGWMIDTVNKMAALSIGDF